MSGLLAVHLDLNQSRARDALYICTYLNEFSFHSEQTDKVESFKARISQITRFYLSIQNRIIHVIRALKSYFINKLIQFADFDVSESNLITMIL